ncbi:MAG TPA: DUF4147 domain-containing protein [Nitrososphaeraceae archaeon]|nr:DUF4147 domain-containing protein [Nitrososphaeraceae archaeon]
MKIIQNEKILYETHGSCSSFDISLSALKTAIKAIDPSILIKNSIQITDNNQLIINDVKGNKYFFNLNNYETFHLFGAGKATARMTKTLMEILNLKFSSGAITIPYHEKVLPYNLLVTEAGHPIPDNNSINGTKIIIKLLKKIKTKSLVFVIISGGASSLMCMPVDKLSLTSKQEITKLLLKSGASIHEINTVRKHLSKIKGGKLPGYLTRKGHIITLILSDVVGDDIDIIGSAPTVRDFTTFADAINILKKYKLWDLNNKNNFQNLFDIKKVLQDGLRDSPEINSNISKNSCNNITNIIIGNNEIACKSAVKELIKNGIKTKYLGSNVNLEAKNFGRQLAQLLVSSHSELNENRLSDESFAYVLGGETVVNLSAVNDHTNKMKIGIGGRNQETIVSSINYLKDLDGLNNFTIISFATDGIDGNSKFAGGLVTPITINTIKEKKIDIKKYLISHDTSNLLKKIKSHILTGRTGTNVNDIAIICNIKES